MLKPNDLGLVDAHGNAYSWCCDFSANITVVSVYSGVISAYNPQDDETITDIGGPNSGSHRVIRGGSFHNDAGGCRSAYRHIIVPSVCDDVPGFRVALSSSGIAQ